jgi:hypothetical protein
MLHCLQHLDHQCEPGVKGQLLIVAVLVERRAFNELEREIRLAIVSHAGIEQARDVRMDECGEDLPLARKAFVPGGAQQARMHQLERHLALEQAIGALGPPYRAHAALAEQPRHPIRPEAAAFEPGLCRTGAAGDAACDQLCGFSPIAVVAQGRGFQQISNHRGKPRFAPGQGELPFGPLRNRQIEGLIQQCGGSASLVAAEAFQCRRACGGGGRHFRLLPSAAAGTRGPFPTRAPRCALKRRASRPARAPTGRRNSAAPPARETPARCVPACRAHR